MQQTELDIDETTKTLLHCAFECYMPEMQEEVVKVVKEKKKGAAGGDADAAQDSKYVQMEPILKAEAAQAQQPATTEAQRPLGGLVLTRAPSS